MPRGWITAQQPRKAPLLPFTPRPHKPRRSGGQSMPEKQNRCHLHSFQRWQRTTTRSGIHPTAKPVGEEGREGPDPLAPAGKRKKKTMPNQGVVNSKAKQNALHSLHAYRLSWNQKLFHPLFSHPTTARIIGHNTGECGASFSRWTVVKRGSTAGMRVGRGR